MIVQSLGLKAAVFVSSEVPGMRELRSGNGVQEFRVQGCGLGFRVVGSKASNVLVVQLPLVLHSVPSAVAPNHKVQRVVGRASFQEVSLSRHWVSSASCSSYSSHETFAGPPAGTGVRRTSWCFYV